MNPFENFKCRLLLIQEYGIWSALCLENNLATSGATKNKALANLALMFFAQLVLDEAHDVLPFSECKEAPGPIQEIYAKSEPAPDSLYAGDLANYLQTLRYEGVDTRLSKRPPPELVEALRRAEVRIMKAKQTK